MESLTKQFEADFRRQRAFSRARWARKHPMAVLTPGTILSHTKYPLRWQVLNTPPLHARHSHVSLRNLHTMHDHTEPYHIVNGAIQSGNILITQSSVSVAAAN